MNEERPRTPGIAYAVLFVVLIVLVATVALTARQPPPPTIAEFAPQAVENITDAPADQSSSSGRTGGSGTAAAGPASPTPQPALSVDVPRVRKCVGDPPRQIEDPQSPPCVPYWVGDNGGATSRGVTRDEIRVALMSPDGNRSRMADDLVAFFNKRFEMYGRRIVLTPVKHSGDNVPTELMQADAANVEAAGMFAALGYSEQRGRENVFYDELARRKVLSVQGAYTGISISDEAHYARYAPYEWNYMPGTDKILRNFGQLACAGLAGRPPRFAGQTQASAATRTFGVFNITFPDGTPSPDLAPLREAAKVCGVKFVEVSYVDGDNSTMSAGIVKMQQAKATTILCMCHTSHVAIGFMPSATGQGYFPEWFVTNFGHGDDDFAAGFYPKAQSEHLLALMSHSKSLPLDQQWWYKALREVDPGYSIETNKRNHISVGTNYVYQNLLLLASGIQMAGPRLTPATFAGALARTKFPNPGAGGPPYYQSTVGFGPGGVAGRTTGPNGYTMVQDFVPVWWSNSRPSPQVEGQYGTYCFADSGLRYGAGFWPAKEPSFQTGDCT